MKEMKGEYWFSLCFIKMVGVMIQIVWTLNLINNKKEITESKGKLKGIHILLYSLKNYYGDMVNK